MTTLQSFSDSSLERIYSPMVQESATDALIAILRGTVFQTVRLNLIVGKLAFDELGRRGVDVERAISPL